MDFEREKTSFLDYLKKYVGLGFNELAYLANMNSKSKAKNAMLVKRIIDSYKGSDFGKAFLEHEDISVKTIQINSKGQPNESMSFPTIDFNGLVQETWDNSTLRTQFSKTFLFFVFEERSDNNSILSKVFFWKMPQSDLDNAVRKTWEKVKAILLSGEVVSKADCKGRIFLNFPKEKDSEVCHVRPHGSNSMDLKNLPKRDATTNYLGLAKQSFWLNKAYVAKIIKDNLGD